MQNCHLTGCRFVNLNIVLQGVSEIKDFEDDDTILLTHRPDRVRVLNMIYFTVLNCTINYTVFLLSKWSGDVLCSADLLTLCVLITFYSLSHFYWNVFNMVMKPSQCFLSCRAIRHICTLTVHPVALPTDCHRFIYTCHYFSCLCYHGHITWHWLVIIILLCAMFVCGLFV